MSAGPLEGMLELMRFFHEPPAHPLTVSDTAFGSLLLTHGLTVRVIRHLASNASIVTDKGPMPVFDATEDMDARKAASLLTASNL